MTTDTLLDSLRRTRDDFEDEFTFHRFLLDAYTGTGGFCGRVKPPAVGALGWAAETYARACLSYAMPSTSDDSTSYLDRFPREDLGKEVASRLDQLFGS